MKRIILFVLVSLASMTINADQLVCKATHVEKHDVKVVLYKVDGYTSRYKFRIYNSLDISPWIPVIDITIDAGEKGDCVIFMLSDNDAYTIVRSTEGYVSFVITRNKHGILENDFFRITWLDESWYRGLFY